MPQRRSFCLRGPAALLLGGLAVAGCRPGADFGASDCAANLLPGELVISEIYANADGADDGREWFELYNATDAAIDLTGIELVHAGIDDSSPRTHVVAEDASIAAGEYFAIGGVKAELAPAYIDYGYGDGLGSLRNSDGKLAVRCNVIEVDAVSYRETEPGASLGVDGSTAPNATANDAESNFCTATVSGGDFNGLGSPGAANEPCGGRRSGGLCDDGDGQRLPVAPGPGDVVITEVMANPDAVGDSSGEWIELVAVASFDLNGLEVGRAVADGAEQVIDAAECLPVAAGDRIVLANNLDAALNGGVDASHELAVGLTNSAGSLFVGHGGSLLDALAWTTTSAGISKGLDPRFRAPGDNDNPDNLCDATTPYGDGDLGTPGRENDSCEIAAPPTGDTCDDGGTERDLVKPTVGDLVITEIMANPAAVNDGAGEWIEVTASRDVDLNGLQLGRDGLGDGLASATCLRLLAGASVVFASNVNPADNGSLPADALVGELGVSLVNSNGAIQIGFDDQVLDRVTWASATAGAATQLDPDLFDPAANDDASAFCPATSPYGLGDLGTPGAANVPCAADVEPRP